MVKVLVSNYPKKFQGQKNITPGFYMNEVLKFNLDIAIKAIKDDWDMFFCVDGVEGAGKSTMAQQIGTYCDPTLTLDRITFTPKEFRKAVMDAKKYECVIYDEAYGGLASRRAISGTNHMLVDMMAEMRQKNLFIVLVLPSFFELDKYPAIHRSRCLVTVYHKRFKRGYFKFYSYKQKKIMYLLGKKTYNHACVRSSFNGRFTNFYTVDINDYKAKKLKHLRMGKDENEKKEKAKVTPMEHAFVQLTKELKLDNKQLRDLSERMGMSQRFLQDKVKRIQKLKEKL